jgi:hypothetical protein
MAEKNDILEPGPEAGSTGADSTALVLALQEFALAGGLDLSAADRAELAKVSPHV